MALQLPDAASLERTDQAARKIEEILSKTPGVQYTTSVVGFSLAESRPEYLQRVLLRHVQALERTDQAGRTIHRHQGEH